MPAPQFVPQIYKANVKFTYDPVHPPGGDVKYSNDYLLFHP